MRLAHWDAFEPVCPACLTIRGEARRLTLAHRLAATDDVVWEGVIHCPGPECGQEYPIVDGVPILVPSVREYVAAYAPQILKRRDLSGAIESLIGDCLGPDDQHNLTRLYLSSYGQAAFPPGGSPSPADSGLLQACVELMGGIADVPVVDVGCGVGGATFRMADSQVGPVLGVDISFAMVQLAQAVLHGRDAVYPHRRSGLVYDQRRVDYAVGHGARIDFWVCDAQSLPFRNGSLAALVGLNLLDSVRSPLGLIDEIGRVLTLGGRAGLATPFDWSAAATPVEGWIGGHSQRSGYQGSATRVLQALFPRPVAGQSARLEQSGERDGVRWETRRSDRSVTVYEDYVFALRKAAESP